jgi:hypothetical protein
MALFIAPAQKTNPTMFTTPTKPNSLKRQAPSSPAADKTPDTTPIKKGAKVSEVPMAPVRENQYLAPRAGFLDNTQETQTIMTLWADPNPQPPVDATGYVTEDDEE